MGIKYYYVTQNNEVTGEEKLLGYNLDKVEADKLFYSLGKNKNSSLPAPYDEVDKGLSNACGCHSKKFKNETEAIKELITKPKEFNDALAVIEKYGCAVAAKKNISRHLKVVSYQGLNEVIFNKLK